MAISQALKNGEKTRLAYQKRDGVKQTPHNFGTPVYQTLEPEETAVLSFHDGLPATWGAETAVSFVSNDVKGVSERGAVEETAVSSSLRENSPQTAVSDQCVKVYPSLLAGFLKGEKTAVGRVYLLVRHLDQEGRGRLPVDDLREALTADQSPLKVYGWRRLRQILNQGEGHVWERSENGRSLHIYNPAKIARSLDVGRFRGNPVNLSVKSLLAGIHTVRAEFYAVFHAGRKHDNPISRAAVREATGVPERTQRNYDKTAGVKAKRNYAVTAVSEYQEAAYTHGHGSFVFVDYKGKRGSSGGRFTAWVLPNSYKTPKHDQAAKGRQRKVNKRLVNLVTNGARGDDQSIDRMYYQDATGAAKATNKGRGSGSTAYYQERGNGRFWTIL